MVVAAALAAAAALRRLRPLGLVGVALLPVIAATLAVNALLPAGGSRAAGVTAALRLLAVTLPPSLLFLSVPIPRLIADLEARGLPPGAAFILLAVGRVVPDVRGCVGAVREARAARGLDGGSSFGSRLRAVSALPRPVFGATLDATEARTLALEVRGFRRARRRTVLEPATDTAADRLVRLLLAGAVLAAAAVRVAWR